MSNQNAPQTPATATPDTPRLPEPPRSARTSAAKPERTRMFADGTGPAADPAGSHFERRIRSFQPRRSRVTTGQEEALRRLWPTWGIDVDGQRVLDLDAMFGGRPVVLEIGFGMG
ncbi:tRNA (guanosine(46)-N7)-methyltransferase TrmB, partial [Streptomyces sp. NPDC014344]